MGLQGYWMVMRGCALAALVAAAACGSTGDAGSPDIGSAPDDDGGGDSAHVDQPSGGDSTPMPVDADPTPPGDPANPLDTVPANPFPFEKGETLRVEGANGPYYVIAPRAYDATHQTPTMLFVYLHGCGGASSQDVQAATEYWEATWLGMAPGDDPQCWQDQPDPVNIVMDAIADMKTHFNIDPKRIHIGGYSSGGDLSYATALAHADTFAGILSYNSIPTYENADLPQVIASAAWKINIVHLSQTGDLVYPIDDVRIQMQMLRSAGFPVTHIERPGLHMDDDTTNLRDELVLPHLRDGFRAP